LQFPHLAGLQHNDRNAVTLHTADFRNFGDLIIILQLEFCE